MMKTAIAVVENFPLLSIVSKSIAEVKERMSSFTVQNMELNCAAYAGLLTVNVKNRDCYYVEAEMTTTE